VSSLVTKSQVITALKRLKDPHSGQDIVTNGFVQELSVGRGHVKFIMRAPDGEQFCPQYVSLAVEAKKAVLALKGVTKVDAVLTRHVQERAVNEALIMLDGHTKKRKSGGMKA
jgi:metal-sulfur cluster biosynthetic enzyme